MPDWSVEIRQRLESLHLPAVREAEIAEELAQHAQDRYQELLASGVDGARAQVTALDEVFAAESLMAELRAIEKSEPEIATQGGPSRASLFGSFLQDIRYAVRTFRKSPGFVATAVLALALGIGANSAIFSVVNAVLLRPLPYPEAERLVRIAESSPRLGQGSVAYPNYQDWRRESKSFEDLGTYRSDDFNFTGTGEAEQLSGSHVSASLFPLLGVKPLLGRVFRAEDDSAGVACTVILSYDFWQRRFGGDRNILGRNLTLSSLECSVIGVMPSEFRFREMSQVYVPIEKWKSPELHDRESRAGLRVIGRLKPGVGLAAARAELATIAKALAAEFPAANEGRGTLLMPMKDDLVSEIRPTLLLLSGAVGFVLIIACANVANLLLARSASRQRELAIRTSLGASRFRLVRQVLSESVLLSLIGAGIGMALAALGMRYMLATIPGTLPRASEIGIDVPVLMFTLGLSMLTGILFGLAPAISGSGPGLYQALKEGTRGAGGGRRRVEGVFVAIEIGLAVILLSGAGLMMQSVWRLLQIDPGFQPKGVLTMQVALSPKALTNAQNIRLAYRELIERVATIPGVEHAAAASLLPLADSDSEIDYWPENQPQPTQDKRKSALFYIVTPDYWKVMQLPLFRGRFIDERDKTGTTPVVVIDEVLSRSMFGSESAVGRSMNLLFVGRVQIVGVVGHVKHWGLDADDSNRIRDQVYFPFAQVPDQFMSEAAAGVTVIARTEGAPMSYVPSVRAQVAGPMADQPVYGVHTMDELISQTLTQRRFMMVLLIVFAATAVLLAAVGIYGVMALAVERRIPELGIRAALGASRREIVGLVVREAMMLGGAGLAVGVVSALLLNRLLKGLLYGVGPADPLTLGAVILVLMLAASAACYVPAKRATSVDPLIALRME